MMRTHRVRVRPAAARRLLAIVASLCSLCAPAGAAGAVSPLPASNYSVRPVCAAPTEDSASCAALQLLPVTAAARARTHPLGITRSAPVSAGEASENAFGLRPQDLHTAYQLPTSAPSTPTVAIVDAYNDPNAEADLTVYDHEFGLPACTSASGCFQKVNERGEAANLPFPETQEALEASESSCEHGEEEACNEVEAAKGWTEEISLDIEVAHATCQNCHIMLVEASSPRYVDFEAAENTAVRLGATAVSNSWGGGEPKLDKTAFNHPGVVITAAAGDSGYLNWGAEESTQRGFPWYPASSPHVVAVGGTRLTLTAGHTAWQSEAVWNGRGATGGGCSLKFTAQPWQLGVSDWASVGCGEKRAVADVAADADPYTGVAVYDSQPGGEGETWRTVGGTSLASPLIASVFALAGGAQGVSYPAETLYENDLKSPGLLHDVLSGSNGKCAAPPVNKGESGCSAPAESESCSGRAICLARTGYDGPSGVGTPDGIGAFQLGGGEASRAGPEGGGPSGESPNAINRVAGASSPGSGVSTSAASPATSSPQLTPTLSGLSLTTRSIVALNRARPKISLLAFAFTLNAPARVYVTLAKRIRVRGHSQWRGLGRTLTIAARKGRNGGRLSGRGTLAPGTYRLTLTPVHGAARSLVFKIA